MADWIKDEYINGRHKIVHGIHDATFGVELRPMKYGAFGRLHEITRVSLLAFLSLDDKKLDELSKSTGKCLQNKLENLGSASGAFIINQRIWAS
jgi:hypothetical protein